MLYYQHRLPIDPASYPSIIGHRLDSSYGKKWYNMLSGERLTVTSSKGVPHLQLNRLLPHFPVALLANAQE